MSRNDEMVRLMIASLNSPAWSTVTRPASLPLPGDFGDALQANPSQGGPESEPDERRKTSPVVSGVTWADIGGQEDAKRQMMEAIELPITRHKVFSYYGIRPPKGILLYGPPGCGKTMFGKAAATALAKLHDRPSSDGSFIYVKATELRDKYVGETEKKVRELFENARSYKRRHGHPSVIFVDEADAILPNRNNCSRYESSVVTTFLTEMDGMEDSGAIVILATNRPESIDPAIVRDGRIDRKIRIGRPCQLACESILLMTLSSIPVKGVTHRKLAKTMVREFFSPERVLFRLHTDAGVHDLTLAHVLNGAMLAGSVSQAASLALHRDLARDTQTGLRKVDAVRAIDSIQRQQLDLDHSDAAKDLIELLGGKLIRVEKFQGGRKAQQNMVSGPQNIFEEAA